MNKLIDYKLLHQILDCEIGTEFKVYHPNPDDQNHDTQDALNIVKTASGFRWKGDSKALALSDVILKAKFVEIPKYVDLLTAMGHIREGGTARLFYNGDDIGAYKKGSMFQLDDTKYNGKWVLE